MMNFGYLENNDSFVALYTACREAEEFALMKPDISATSARKAMEWVVRYIYSEIDANPPYGYTVFDMVNDARFQAQFADAALLSSIDFIRKAGNIAVHQGNLSTEDALHALEHLHFLVGEFAIGVGITAEYDAFVIPEPNRMSSILGSIHSDNSSLNILPYLRAEHHGEWAEILSKAGRTHIAELIELPEEVNCDEFIDFLKLFEKSMKKEVEEILEMLPLSIGTEAEWNERRANLPKAATERVERYVTAYIEDNQKAFVRLWTYYNQALGDKAAAYLWLVHPEYVPESMKDAYVKPDVADVTEEEEFISLEDAVKQLLRQLASESLRKRELMTKASWCNTNLGIPVQVLRAHSSGKAERTLYSEDAVHMGDKKYFVYLKWEKNSLMRLRNLTGQLGESLVTPDRLADWGFAIPGSEAEKRAQQRAERRKAAEEARQLQAQQVVQPVLPPEPPKEAIPSEIRAYINEKLNQRDLLSMLTSESWCRELLGLEFPVLISYEDRRLLLRRQQNHGNMERIYSAVMCSIKGTDYFVKRMTTAEFEHFKRIVDWQTK